MRLIGGLCHAFSSTFTSVVATRTVLKTTTFLLAILPNIHRFYNIFTGRLGNKPYYTALQFTVNRSFPDINFSQGSVATYARCGEICNKRFTANLLGIRYDTIRDAILTCARKPT